MNWIKFFSKFSEASKKRKMKKNKNAAHYHALLALEYFTRWHEQDEKASDIRVMVKGSPYCMNLDDLSKLSEGYNNTYFGPKEDKNENH